MPPISNFGPLSRYTPSPEYRFVRAWDVFQGGAIFFMDSVVMFADYAEAPLLAKKHVLFSLVTFQFFFVYLLFPHIGPMAVWGLRWRHY